MTDVKNIIAQRLYSMEGFDQRKVLIISKYTERTRINLLLLKFFLKERGRRGIFITVDRPHQYISYLLKLHNVSQKDLIYIDTVSIISGEGEFAYEQDNNVCFLNGPNKINSLQDLITNGFIDGGIPKHEIDLKKVDFILMDDVAALYKYNIDNKIEEFLFSYLSAIETMKNIMAPIVLDVNKNKSLYKIITNNCDKVLLVNLSKSIVKDLKSGDGSDTLAVRSLTPSLLSRKLSNAKPDRGE